ncbi:protein kinase [Nocardioides sp. NPDC023903]|uniref:protein kinase domain-containing protein n=1 Tax=Nocardioides sp. NPDC023903 TaxID=3157195 RepID=UPI0033CC436B
MASPHHEPPTIPGFDHRRLIGAGGSSVVFLYAWPQEKVDVAVKVWNDRLSGETQDALAKETKEVAELAAHPHVLPLHAVGVSDDDRCFVVMDHRAGGDLQTRWKRERLPVAEALSITIKVAGALDVAARHGILHGDVKPANILMTSGGEPQLVGFGGLSSAGRPGGADSTSLPWMAPEMLSDPPEPSAWADIWSLAATCYTLLAGRTPFEGSSGRDAPVALVERIREYDPLSIDRDDVPPSFEEALRKAMFKRRAGRHWSAADFAKALQAVEAELGLPVTPLAEMREPRDEVPEVAEVTEVAEVAEPAPIEVAPDPVPSQTESPGAGDTAEVPIVTGPVNEPVIDPVVEPMIAPAPMLEQTDDDVLGHRGDVDRLARLLASARTQLPISVAVQGLPGSGRSTFLRKVQERMEWLTEHDETYPARTTHVRIDARQYAEGDVAGAVLDSVRSAGKSEPPPLVAKHQAAQRRTAELRAALAGVPEDDGPRGKRRAQPMSTTMALAAMDREVAAYEAALRAAPPGPPPGPSAGALRAPLASRTIVYVDDLDKCDPATAAGVLQAIDELSGQEGVAVVAAVDAQVLRRAIEGRVAEPAAYLSRVFDVPFALRAFAGDPAVRFMRSLMRQAVPSWPAALAAGTRDRAGRLNPFETFEMTPGEALFTSELARFCPTPGAARKLLAVYRLARTAPVASVGTEPAGHHALGILMAILVGAPAQAVQVLGAVVESLAAGEDGATFRKLLEKVAREHTAGCGRATCGSCADWSRVLRAHADLVRAQQVPQEVGAYAAWVDEVARFSFPT